MPGTGGSNRSMFQLSSVLSFCISDAGPDACDVRLRMNALGLLMFYLREADPDRPNTVAYDPQSSQ
jgi:hypothetical protein